MKLKACNQKICICYRPIFVNKLKQLMFDIHVYINVIFVWRSSESALNGLTGAGKPPLGVERASGAELDSLATHPTLPWQPLKSCVSPSWGGVCGKFQEFFRAEPDSAGMKFLWGGCELDQRRERKAGEQAVYSGRWKLILGRKNTISCSVLIAKK